MNAGGVFVTGTDTGVGKTIVGAALAGAMCLRGIDAGVMKPIQTGVSVLAPGRLTDADYLKAVSGCNDPIELICPVMLAEPLAPSVAARIQNTSVSLDAIRHAFLTLTMRHEFLIVEGAGGLAVPITDDYLMSDLAAEIGYSIVIVTRPGLGAINHTVLTASFARAANLHVAGIIVANWPDKPGLAESTNSREIELHTGLPILGFMSHDKDVDVEAGSAGTTVQALQESGLVERLMGL